MNERMKIDEIERAVSVDLRGYTVAEAEGVVVFLRRLPSSGRILATGGCTGRRWLPTADYYLTEGEPMREEMASGYNYQRDSPNYYAESNGIMLEAFPAMDEVLHRLTYLPADEQQAWGLFLMGIGQRLVELGSGCE